MFVRFAFKNRRVREPRQGNWLFPSHDGHGTEVTIRNKYMYFRTIPLFDQAHPPTR